MPADRKNGHLDSSDPVAIAKAICALDAWDKGAAHNWVLVSKMLDEPYVAVVLSESAKDSKLRARLMLFQGFSSFREFALTKQFSDFGVATQLYEFRHLELLVARDGSFELLVCDPGYRPIPPDAWHRQVFAKLLYECYGVLMRLEEDENLPLKFAEENALFAREEGLDGKWHDGPYRIPDGDGKPIYVERVSVDKAKCAQAAKMPIVPEVWEVDFKPIPTYSTTEPRPRLLYLFAAVDAATGERRAWFKLSVSDGPDGLKKLWEGLAERLLSTFVERGSVPGSLSIRSARLIRFIRPLAMQVPFKMIQHAKLPALDSVLTLALATNDI